MSKLSAVLFLSVVQFQHAAFLNQPITRLFAYAGVVATSEYIVQKYLIGNDFGEIPLTKHARFVSFDLSRELKDLFLESPFIESSFKKYFLIASQAMPILKLCLQIGSLFCINKIFAPKISHRTSFYNTLFIGEIPDTHKTVQERLFFMFFNTIPEIHFFINKSPFSFERHKNSLWYTISIGIIERNSLLFPSPRHFHSKLALYIPFVKKALIKKIISETPPEEHKLIEERLKKYNQESDQFSILFQAIRAAYFFSLIFGLLNAPFPDAYTFFSGTVAQLDQSHTIKAQALRLLIKMMQNGLYICLYRIILYPALKKIHEYLIHPIEKLIYKDDQKRFVSYVISGMILFFFCNKALNKLYQTGIICATH